MHTAGSAGGVQLHSAGGTYTEAEEGAIPSGTGPKWLYDMIPRNMATFTKGKRGDGTVTWRAQVRLKGFPAETATFDTKVEAKQWAAHIETEVRAGRRFGVIESRKSTLSMAIDRYLRDILPKKRDTTNQARQLEWWREKLGTLALADVTPARVVACRDELARGETVRGKRSPATVNRYLAVLSHLFTVAVKEWQITTENPCTRVAKLKEPRGRVRCLSEGELWLYWFSEKWSPV